MHDSDGYCRELEAYLCRKNDGHLIRIVGPAFEQVSGWAAMGIPIKVAYAGIDRYFERYYRRGRRRRPVRIEFCEADILDAFDDWRRAVGVSIAREADAGGIFSADAGAATLGDESQDVAGARRRVSLVQHIERAIARLTLLRASARLADGLTGMLDDAIRELDAAAGVARSVRGAARDALITSLAALDRRLLDAALTAADDATRAAAAADAHSALAPFRERMTPDTYRHAVASAVDRCVREHFNLPVVAFT